MSYTEEHARRFIAAASQGWADGSQAPFAIVGDGDDAVLGAITLHCGWPRRWGVGYWIAPWARRRGVATASLRRVSDASAVNVRHVLIGLASRA